jgi:hypothetical protein
MEIFLSWSGERSKSFAQIFYDWLPKVIQSIKPWMSSSDIDKGDQWLAKISEKLKINNFGIICLTSENVNAPWVLFEAGALSSKINQANVCPILFDFEPPLLSGPLSQFQATKFNKADILQLLKSVNKNIEPQKLPEKQLEETFEVWWPKLENEIAKVPKSSEKKPERSQKEMLEEVVMFTRAFSKDYFRQKWEWNISMGMRKTLARLTPREEKTIRMLHGIQEPKNYSIKEIATEFKLTQKEVTKIIQSAKTKLSQYNILEIIEDIKFEH